MFNNFHVYSLQGILTLELILFSFNAIDIYLCNNLSE